MYSKEIRPAQDKTLKYFYFMDKEHPLSDAKGRVWLHRHVASISLGRWLVRSEVVHHIDGDRENNSPENLTVTTQSEHAKIHHPTAKPSICRQCGGGFQKHAGQKTCSIKCKALAENKTLCLVSKQSLEKLVWNKPTTKVAAELGVSDSAVGKMCRKLGVKKPPRGYWAKMHSISGPQ